MIEEIKKQLKQKEVYILGHENMKKYAVTIPLIQLPDEPLSVLFEVRAKTLRRQPCEISFPGGKIDPTDNSPKDAAIRETVEELGIKKDDIEVIHTLDTYIPTNKSIIYPFVTYLDTKFLSPNPSEVDHIFTVPLDYLLHHEPQAHDIKLRVEPDRDFPLHLIPGGENYPWRYTSVTEFFYLYQEKVIWGMTARILHHFINLIR